MRGGQEVIIRRQKKLCTCWPLRLAPAPTNVVCCVWRVPPHSAHQNDHSDRVGMVHLVTRCESTSAERTTGNGLNRDAQFLLRSNVRTYRHRCGQRSAPIPGGCCYLPMRQHPPPLLLRVSPIGWLPCVFVLFSCERCLRKIYVEIYIETMQ